MRDTSLDDFLGEDGTEGADGADGEGAGDDSASDADGADVDEAADEANAVEAEAVDAVKDVDEAAHGTDAVQPAVSTYEWTPDGATCAECEVVVDRRWRDDGVLVCADCKEW